MQVVGVLDLRQNLAKHLDRVADGEHLIIVQRSKPIARLIPYQEDTVSEDPAPYRVTPLANQSELTDLALFLADGDKVEAARLLALAAAELLKAQE